MSLLSIHNVCKSYGNVKALTDFSAELDCGGYALLGPNGSGKSTLMNILTDNLAMDSGEILYNGKKHIFARQGVSRCPRVYAAVSGHVSYIFGQ